MKINFSINAEFTPEEVVDIRAGLVLAMKELDNHKGNAADKKLANRLEFIEKKFAGILK